MKLWQAEGEAKLRANREGRPVGVWLKPDGTYRVGTDSTQPGEEMTTMKMPDQVMMAQAAD